MSPTGKRRPAESPARKLKKSRAGILQAVKQYARLLHAQEEFRPGKDRVHYAGRVFTDSEYAAMVNASLDAWVTFGPYGQRLERELARYLGVKQVVLVNSGSSANLLAVAALCSPQWPRALKPGDEVITPAVTFPTTLAPLIQYNLVPVFVDSKLGDYNLDVSRLEGALSQKTRAIMIPHTLGNPCQMDEILRLAERYQLSVIEDNCDALGSRYQGKLTGTFGLMSTFSFYPAHHMTMGEGGAVAVNDAKLAKLLRSLRDWGRDCWCTSDSGPEGACRNRLHFKLDGVPEGYDHRYVYTSQGYNLKPTDIQAALGLAQLKKLDGFIRTRQKNFLVLRQGLARYEPWLLLPEGTEGSAPSWFAFPITVREQAGFSRKDLTAFLESRGIETRLLFAGNIIRQPAYRYTHYRVYGGLENADAIMRRTFFIGVYPGLQGKHLRYILSMFAAFFRNRA